ncbi:restriction endonuclease subunit S [Mycobacterium sp. BMJ-28]
MTAESTVGELIETLIDYRGKTPTKTKSGVPLITAKVIKGGTILAEPREYIAENEYDAWMRRGLPARGDILITTEAPLGEVARVSDPRIALAQRVILLRPDASKVDPSFLFHYLRSPQAQAALGRRSSGTTVSGIRQPELKAVEVPLLARSSQEAVGVILDAIDDLIENSRRRVEVLKEMSRAIYREWFVKFRYPGHIDVPLVDSALGPIPDGWTVGTVHSVASSERYSTASGPFGSKLGRKDYQADGVPVIRGANLRVGGGFDETDFVFVSEAKAAELRSATAVQGDILVTQRGTLGQVGRIPPGARFDRYVLSQSQMKVTVDKERVAPYFVYAQLCSEQVTQRFIAQAMSAGVPHVNLRLLREFLIIIPPRRLQHLYSDSALPLTDLAVSLERENHRLATLRDLLLPKLVSGQLDVSALDLDAVTGEKVA